jgi:hypothetical protein
LQNNFLRIEFDLNVLHFFAKFRNQFRACMILVLKFNYLISIHAKKMLQKKVNLVFNLPTWRINLVLCFTS